MSTLKHTKNDDGSRPERRTVDVGIRLGLAGVAGAISMGLEVAGARALAPSFGTSINVWGVLISTILTAMALGYAAGGWLIDRWPTSRTLYATLLASAVLQIGTIATGGDLLARLRDWSEFSGTLIASTMLAGTPTVLLAATCPCVVRLNHRAGAPGKTAGWAYALTTVGSIAGVLVTTFVLLPRVGTRATHTILCAITAAAGLVGLAFDGSQERRTRAIWTLILSTGIVVCLAIERDLGVRPDLDRPAAARILWQGESAYNTLRVVALGPRLRGLIVGRDDALHTAIVVDSEGRPAPEPTGAYWDLFAVGPRLTAGHRVLSLGMGAGASIHAARWADPGLIFDAVEIDPRIVDLARAYFGVAESPTLRIHVADARRFLARHPALRYDIVQVDLFRGYAAIPFHLATVEFYREMADHLEPSGVAMINVFDASMDASVLRRIERTLADVFPSLYVHSSHAMNHMVFAFPRPRTREDIERALVGPGAEDVGHPRVEAIAREVASGLREVRFDRPPADAVMTDDRNDIEQLTHRMLTAARRSGRLPQRPR
ncbi:MAG: fused MFS/spermidine synthase [Deltaproteobacteria bacterium]|nr:fused MFS/spermidine synthase [Deltaproteobacteria bacterium]